MDEPRILDFSDCAEVAPVVRLAGRGIAHLELMPAAIFTSLERFNAEV